MKRPGRFAASCLVAGLLVASAIAWGSAMLAPQPEPLMGVTPAPGAKGPRPVRLFAHTSQTFYPSVGAQARARNWLVRRERIILPSIAPTVGAIAYDVCATGWPLPALEWTVPDGDGGAGYPGMADGLTWMWETGVAYRSRVDPSTWEDSWRRLPLRPWRYGVGLAANSLVWGVAAAGAAWIAGAVRGKARADG